MRNAERVNSVAQKASLVESATKKKGTHPPCHVEADIFP